MKSKVTNLGSGRDFPKGRSDVSANSIRDGHLLGVERLRATLQLEHLCFLDQDDLKERMQHGNEDDSTEPVGMKTFF